MNKIYVFVFAVLVLIVASCSGNEESARKVVFTHTSFVPTTIMPECTANQKLENMGGDMGWQCVSSAPSSTVSYTPITTTPTTTAAPVVSGRCNRLADTVDKTFRESGLPMSSIEIYPSSDCVISGYTKACFQGRCYSPYEACPQIEAGLRRGMYSIVSEHAVDAPIAIAEEPDKCLVILFL